jgi:hypothetical protein
VVNVGGEWLVNVVWKGIEIMNYELKAGDWFWVRVADGTEKALKGHHEGMEMAS